MFEAHVGASCLAFELDLSNSINQYLTRPRFFEESPEDLEGFTEHREEEQVHWKSQRIYGLELHAQ